MDSGIVNKTSGYTAIQHEAKHTTRRHDVETESEIASSPMGTSRSSLAAAAAASFRAADLRLSSSTSAFNFA